MIPKNKRHLIVNKEYSRLPYWTDEGYEDVQRQVSQKYVQDNYGKFAESENQPPYLSDADYQGLEYQYQNPEFFDPTDLPDVDMKNTTPKGTCYELWVSLFGSSPHGFFPTASEYAQLMEYAKKCPLIYMPHWCCSPSSMKISGPASVAPGEKVEYTVSGGLEGCSYRWDADRGWMVSGTYEAPDTPGSDRITVSPYLSDDMGKVCAFKDITIEGGCHGVIGYTTAQMSVGGTQTLTVTGGSETDTYTWTTTSGSFNTDTGTSVTFTAPASNANCTSNPTISLTCGGAVVDTLQIAVNAVGGASIAWEEYINKNCAVRTYWTDCYVTRMRYFCDGTLDTNPYFSNCVISAQSQIPRPPLTPLPTDCPTCYNHATALVCGSGGRTIEVLLALPNDVRTEWLKANGCCPSQML